MSLTYTDKFLEQTSKQYGPEDLQLVGVTAVYIAAKVEEVYVPSIKYFSKCTNYSQSVKKICVMEREMMQVLKFKLHPVTLLTWVDWYTKAWDEYAGKFNLHALTECEDAFFRVFTYHSYNRLRSLLSYLDAVAIDF